MTAKGTPSKRGCLAEICVVDTGSLRSAFAGRLLADLGAEVWKIEPPGGDPARRQAPCLRAAPGRSLSFELYNAGKRSLVVDPSNEGELARLRHLLRNADVWIDSTGPGEDPAWPLDPGAIGRDNPRLVTAGVTRFGLDGPFSRYTATDLVAQAAGGMIFTNGFPGEAPLQGFGLQAYHAASAYAVIGILLALIERARSGCGQTIDVSLQEAAAGALEETSAAWNSERRVEVRRGPVHWTRVFRTVRCRDGYVMVCLIGDWTTLLGWMTERGEGAELGGEEWEDFSYRRDHADEVYRAIDRWAAVMTASEILDGAQLRRLPFAAVRPPEALLSDPQIRSRGFFSPLSDGLVFPGPPFRMSKTPLCTRGPAPRLGEHPEEPSRPTGASPQPRRAEAPRRVLEGTRILDFTHVVAGPLATRVLADHGADVIKIERKVTLDLGERRGGFYGDLNRGKQSLILDLSDPRGVDLARRLAALSDVVIDNFSSRVMGQWGLDHQSLRKVRTDIITVGMSGFGKTGPHKDYVSFGPTLHALCGHTLLMRRPPGEPAGWGFSHSDICAGLNGAIAVLAALYHRARTGEGQAIDLSQLESVAAFMGPALLDMANNGAIPEPAVNRSQEGPAAPHGIYRAAGDDRWVAIAVMTDADWRRFGAAVAEPWVDDPSFASIEARVSNAAALDEAVESWTMRRSPEETTTLLQSRGVPAFTVANGEDLCERDPQLRARGYWARVPTPEGGVAVLDGVPSRLSRTPGAVAAPGPLHGEHTDRVLAEVLGVARDEIRELRTAKVVA